MARQSETGPPKLITEAEMSDAIRRSGYLLEQRVAAVLQEADYYVVASAAYPDPFTGKSREIDIEAHSGRPVYAEGDFIFSILMCECENNAQPVVFFEKESEISCIHHWEVKCAGVPIQVLERGVSDRDANDYESVRLPDFLGFDKYHHYCRELVATQYCTFTRKKQDDPWVAFHSNEQHDSFSSLVYAVEHNIAEFYSNWQPPGKEEEEPLHVNFLYPVLVLQGPLYTAVVDGGQLVLTHAEHVQYRKEVWYQNENETYQIDVVREPFLPQYLELVDAELERARNVLRYHKKHVRKSISALMQKVRARSPEESVRDVLS